MTTQDEPMAVALPTEPLWDENDYVDDGDMETSERVLLVTLVRSMFITKLDKEWKTLISSDLSRVRRDLSNLGLSLVIDDRMGVAWARQVTDDVRPRELPALRRGRRPENAVTVHAALSLRRHWDICEARGETDPHVTDDELRAIIESGPLRRECDGDAERMDAGIARTRERLRDMGILRNDSASSTMRLLPTILVLVDDELCKKIAADSTDEDATNDVENNVEETDEEE